MNAPEHPDPSGLSPQADETKRPSPQFLAAAQDVGERLALDAERIIAGEAIDHCGLWFWLAHHGDKDPDGLLVCIHMGEIAPDFERTMFRAMLEHNAMTPAAVNGYYSVVPGSNTVAFCVRLDLQKSPAPAEAALLYVALFAKQIEELRSVMTGGLEHLGSHSATAAAGAA